MELQVFVRCFDEIISVTTPFDGKVSDIILQLSDCWSSVATEDGEVFDVDTELCDSGISADDVLIAVERKKFHWEQNSDDFFEVSGLAKGIINYDCFKVQNNTVEKGLMQNKTFCFSAVPGIPEAPSRETIRIKISGLKQISSRQQTFDGIGFLSTFNCGFLSFVGIRYRPCDGAVLHGRTILGSLPPATEGTVVTMSAVRTFSSTFISFNVEGQSFTCPWDAEGVLFPTVQVEQVGAKFTIL